MTRGGRGNATDANSGLWCWGRSGVRAMSGMRGPGRRRCGRMTEEAAVGAQDSAEAGWDRSGGRRTGGMVRETPTR